MLSTKLQTYLPKPLESTYPVFLTLTLQSFHTKLGRQANSCFSSEEVHWYINWSTQWMLCNFRSKSSQAKAKRRGSKLGSQGGTKNSLEGTSQFLQEQREPCAGEHQSMQPCRTGQGLQSCTGCPKAPSGVSVSQAMKGQAWCLKRRSPRGNKA